MRLPRASFILAFLFFSLFFAKEVFAATPGDIDKDGDVDIFDYNLLASNFGQTGANDADLDGDQDVDIFDYNILVSNFGKTSAPTNTPAPPSPETDPRITCEGYPEKRVFLESQSWWSDSRVPFPGAHIHLGTCFPLLQEISGTVHFDVRGILHHDPGEVTLLRVQIFDTGIDSSHAPVLQKISWRCPAGQNCIKWFPIDVDTTRTLNDGRWEFRMTFNVPDTPEGPNGGNRQFETTRWHAYLRNGKPSKDYSSIDRIGTAGWYSGSSYSNVRLRAADALTAAYGTVRGIWTPEVWGEKDTLIVSIDAANHGHDPGIVVFEGEGKSVWRKVTIDTTKLFNGKHKLFIRTDDFLSNGTSSGVFVIPFTVAN